MPNIAEKPPPLSAARPYLVRSLGLLRTVRGLVIVSILVGFFVALLPFVAGAAFGPLIQAMGKAAAQGDLEDVWALSGALFSRADASSAGPFGHLAVPLPFAVLLTIWSGSLVLSQALSFFRSWIDAQVEWRLLAEVRQRVHDHLQTLSLDFFTGARCGSLMQRVLLEATGIQRLLSDCLLPPVIDAVVVVAALTYMTALSWQMTLVSLLLSPMALLTLRFAGRNLQTATRRMVMSNRRLGGEIEETITGIADIQAFNAEEQRSRQFDNASTDAAKSSALMLVWVHLSANSAQVFIALSTALVLIIGIAFGSGFGLTLASLVVFVQFVPTMFAPTQRIIQAYTTYQSIAPSVLSTYELLDTSPTVAEKPGAQKLPELRGNIKFEEVEFSYSTGQKVLNKLSFSIGRGETVAIVGPIGSGKSTIFNLLLRFLDPQSGRILLDENHIDSVTLTSLRSQVSKLAQFPFFLKNTIRENVRMGRAGASNDEIEEACKQAHIDEVIVDSSVLPLGYDTVVDVQVPSGGQKRLIALARCLLRKPAVLLLDEPTENLDAGQRLRVTRTIRQYARGRTCVVISHDIDFVAAVSDRILVLDQGRIVEEGTHEELMASGGLYRRLYEAQNADPALIRKGEAPTTEISSEHDELEVPGVLPAALLWAISTRY